MAAHSDILFCFHLAARSTTCCSPFVQGRLLVEAAAGATGNPMAFRGVLIPRTSATSPLRYIRKRQLQK
jgi:hypothetical protein